MGFNVKLAEEIWMRKNRPKLRTICPHCKSKVRPSEKIKEYILGRIKSIPLSAKKEIKIDKDFYIFEPKGCEKCNFKGFAGRIGLFEVLPMSDELAKAIIKDPDESIILKIAREQGMLTMEQEGILKVLAGETTVDEVMRATEEK